MMRSWCRKASIFGPRTILNMHSMHKPNSTTMPKLIGMPSHQYEPSQCAPRNYGHRLSWFPGHNSTYVTASSSCRVVNEGMDEKHTRTVDLEIISTERIKPASPTPHHLRTFNLSALDQLMYNAYTHMFLFIPNTDKTSISNVVTKRSKRLKESLSELLTDYYPFAGEVTDNLYIECNDKGVNFVEARVNQTLDEFLSEPEDQKLKQLKPESTTESSLSNYISSIQVSIFICGGICLSTSFSHKIIDGETYLTFMKAWAAVASGLSPIPPSFVASKLFPTSPSTIENSLPSKLLTTEIRCIKRFVFDSKALASLKAQPVACTSSKPSRDPTRTEATTSLVWKAAAKAASTIRPFSPDSPHALGTMVNLRKRAFPPFPKNSIGNIIDVAVGICFPKKQPDLSTLMGEIRESIARMNSDYIESVQGEKGQKKIYENMKMMNDLMNVIDQGDFLIASSMLNSGMYDIDFGWGKPLWFYFINIGNPRHVHLNEMKKGGAVEAVVSLSSSEMEIFERDPDILNYTTLNPSPLQLLDR